MVCLTCLKKSESHNITSACVLPTILECSPGGSASEKSLSGFPDGCKIQAGTHNACYRLQQQAQNKASRAVAKQIVGLRSCRLEGHCVETVCHSLGASLNE